jgi:hypothetical protein
VSAQTRFKYVVGKQAVGAPVLDQPDAGSAPVRELGLLQQAIAGREPAATARRHTLASVGRANSKWRETLVLPA